MSVDHNWLYSTIAQSSAAIVAIIGGFITANVLTLNTEKKNLSNQKLAKESNLSSCLKEEKKLINLYETMKVEMFLFRIEDDLIKYDVLPPLGDLIKQYGHIDLDAALLEREYTSLTKQRIAARNYIEQNMEKYELIKFSTLEEWIRNNCLDISSYDYGILEDEYIRYRIREVSRQQEEAAKKEEERRKSMSPLMRSIMFSPMVNFRMPMDLPNVQASYAQQQQLQNKQRGLDNTHDRLNLLSYEIQLLEDGISNLVVQLNNITYSPNIGWGLAILSFLALFGIVFPVVIITFESFELWSKLVALISFCIGIVGVFVYVIVLLRTFKK